MVTIRTTRGGAAVILIVLGAVGLFYVSRGGGNADLDRGPRSAVTTAGINTTARSICLVQKLDADLDQAIARSNEEHRTDDRPRCSSAHMEALNIPEQERVQALLVRGAKVEQTRLTDPGDSDGQLVKLVIDGNVVYEHSPDKPSWVAAHLGHLIFGGALAIGIVVLITALRANLSRGQRQRT